MRRATRPSVVAPPNLLPWWLLGVAMLNWFRTMSFSNDVTKGDLLAILVPIAMALIYWLYREWLRRNPFTIRFTNLPLDVPEAIGYRRRRFRKWVAPTGKSIVYLVVMHRRGGPVSWFGVSVGKRDYHIDQPDPQRLGWKPEHPEVARVIDVHIAPKRGKEFAYEALPEGRHYRTDIHFVEAPIWFRREPLFIEVLIEAPREWSGRISFYGDDGNLGRPSVSAKLVVTDDADAFGRRWGRADDPKRSISRKAARQTSSVV